MDVPIPTRLLDLALWVRPPGLLHTHSTRSRQGGSVVTLAPPPLGTALPRYWLFSREVDLLAFLGPAVVALAGVAVGAWFGLLQPESGHSPEWVWVSAVLLVDVAHVWATGFRVYFHGTEWRRRPLLYTLTPVGCFLLGLVLYQQGSAFFWSVLAYMAVFHFIRQQYGWVALYRARRGERDCWGAWVDTVAIYAATGYPLVYWHCHLPRSFWWFLPNDFVELPRILDAIGWPMYLIALGLYGTRCLRRGLLEEFWNPGKDIVVATTAVCWGVGIVVLDSEFAFTITNVLIHGIPYMVLVYWYRYRLPKLQSPTRGTARSAQVPSWAMFLATIWMLAFLEEFLWDRAIWQERAWLFGPAWELSPRFHELLVPLLAVPQLTHYVLDGLIWRRRGNPDVRRSVASH